ncbi:MAG TPA: MMPL family transporter, partial [Marmoricola sp.]|nr:MMPL family transporter [Marmoricola sp.]
GRLTSRRPWFVVGAWILLAVVVVALAPGLKSTSDQKDFLPKSYDSIKASEVLTKAFPELAQNNGATLVFTHKDGSPLNPAVDGPAISTIVNQLNVGTDFDPSAARSVEFPPKVAQPKAAIVNLILAKGVTGQDQSQLDQAATMRTDLAKLASAKGYATQTTGQIPENYDQSKSGKSGEAIVMIATILLIVILLGWIFRSVLAALTPIVLIVLVFLVSNGLIGTAAKWFGLQADTQLQVILGVVLFGIGTDYFLFFLFRYREARRNAIEHRESVEFAVTRAGEAIASAGGAVIVAFATLGLSTLGMFKSMGPALAIAVAVMLLAALTLIPAVVTLLGRAMFWPSKKWQNPSTGSRFERIGKSLGKRPTTYATVTGGLLVLLTLFCFVAGGFKPTFDLSSSNSSTSTESARATKLIENVGFSAGATQPAQIVVTSKDAMTPASVCTIANAAYGVQGVSRPSLEGQSSGHAATKPVKLVPVICDGHLAGVLSEDGRTAMLQATLNAAPASDKALALVKNDLRPAVKDAASKIGATGYVGGLTAVFVDFQAAMNHDYSIVFPVAAIIIMIILGLLLRSIVAPWYLMLSVGLGFGATLGSAVIVFQHIKGDPGLIFMLPILIYLFVVALGTDYNILMISRLREEAREGKSPRDAAAEAVHHAGPTIAVAGVILAGTFASLMLGGNSFLLTMGFSVAFGILVAAFVMAMFFTPALTALIGHAAWWPGHADEKKAEDKDDDDEPTLVSVS